MGCDYYICKVINIYLKTLGMPFPERIEISRTGGYFRDSEVDSDSDVEKYDYSGYLEVNYVPKILYILEDGWKTEYIKNKYKDVIKEYNIDMTNVIKIIKEEERDFRY